MLLHVGENALADADDSIIGSADTTDPSLGVARTWHAYVLTRRPRHRRIQLLTFTRRTFLRRGLLMAIAAMLVVSASLASALPTMAAPVLPTPPPAAPPGEFLDVQANPAFSWSVPSRYRASWAAWNPATTTYNASVINPVGWTVLFDGCSSTSLYRITRYTYSVAQQGTRWKYTSDGSTCQRTLSSILPDEGDYIVTLTLHTSLGVSRPVAQRVTIRDHLIVSIGDSFASGEGNPDVPGDYSSGIHQGTGSPVHWMDARCHRSARSGPALAAAAIENADPHSSVTFVSVACSGAKLTQLVNKYYEGMQPPHSMTCDSPHPDAECLKPQVDAVASLLGPTAARGGRHIDALLISAGVNDLGFATIIKSCASSLNQSLGGGDCVRSTGADNKLKNINYSPLAATIKLKLPDVREIYVSDYPAAIFVNGACSTHLGLPGIGIDEVDGSIIETYGGNLNSKIADAVLSNNDSRWNLAGGMEMLFYDHPYCSSSRWFVWYEDSQILQGNQDGTAHPNAAGSAAYAAALRRAMVLTGSTTPYQYVTVTIDAIKAAASSDVPTEQVYARMFRDQSDLDLLTRYYAIPRNGQWTPIPAGQGTFAVDMFLPPASPRHATEVRMTINGQIPIGYTHADVYGAGSHTFTHPTGSLAVRYTITVVSPPPTGPVVGP